MQEITTFRIKKGEKDNGFNISDENLKKEFKTLINLTDNDRFHLEQLVDNKREFLRYKDIRTYKYNYVPISSGGQYINASWISMPHPNYFICTQGPLHNTIDDFWSMIFEHDVKVIVMLCKVVEDGKEKCAKYWEENTQIFQINKFSRKQVDELIILRVFKILNKNTNETKEVKQIHFIGWPDFGTPNLEETFGNFERIIKTIIEHRNGKPVVVHCSAGIGRTGTFVALYNIHQEIWKQIYLKEYEENDEIIFSIFGLIRKLKEMRLFLVQNFEQYTFVYDFVRKMLRVRNVKNFDKKTNKD